MKEYEVGGRDLAEKWIPHLNPNVKADEIDEKWLPPCEFCGMPQHIVGTYLGQQVDSVGCDTFGCINNPDTNKKLRLNINQITFMGNPYKTAIPFRPRRVA